MLLALIDTNREVRWTNGLREMQQKYRKWNSIAGGKEKEKRCHQIIVTSYYNKLLLKHISLLLFTLLAPRINKHSRTHYKLLHQLFHSEGQQLKHFPVFFMENLKTEVLQFSVVQSRAGTENWHSSSFALFLTTLFAAFELSVII